MVQYRASKEVLRDSESELDEFDSSNTQAERELPATLEVVRGIVGDLIEIGCGDAGGSPVKGMEKSSVPLEVLYSWTWS